MRQGCTGERNAARCLMRSLNIAGETPILDLNQLKKKIIKSTKMLQIALKFGHEVYFDAYIFRILF